MEFLGMARIDNYKPQPGAKNPSKYPFVGANYNLYGEQPGFIYDPYSDGYYADPRARQQQYEAEGLIDKPKEPPSLTEQLLPVGLAAGALYGGKEVGSALGAKLPGLFGLGGSSASGSTAGLGTATTQGVGATVGANAAGAGAASQGVATAANGGTMLADGTVAAGTEGGLLSLGGVGPGPLAAIAAGTYLGGKSAYDMLKGKNDKSIPGLIGRGTLGIATGGLSEVARPFLTHKSTKEYQQDRWGKLADSSDPATKSFATQYQQYLDSPQAETDAQYENTFAGKKQAGTLKSEDVWGAPGIIETFGSDWFNKYNENDRRTISQALIDKDQIISEHGDMSVKDEALARQIATEALTSKPAGNTLPQRKPTPVPRLPVDPNKVPSSKSGLLSLGSR